MPRDLVARVNWDLIYPPLARASFELADRCRKRGVDYWAISGYRSPEEQLKLWQKGRDAKGAVVQPKEVVTTVRFSAHCAGAAVDWARDLNTAKAGLQPSWAAADFEVLAEEAEALGLEAGHRWRSFRDSPHVQLPLSKHSVTLAQLRNLSGKGGLKAVWRLLDQAGFDALA